jgi:DNA-binding HxlR family transcriptional regulator
MNASALLKALGRRPPPRQALTRQSAAALAAKSVYQTYTRLMKKSSFARWPCSIARMMDVFGDAWAMLVMREAFYGIRRFDDFHSGLGIARNTLAERLRRLVDEGLMERQLYQSQPRRYEYVLTAKGTDFFPVIAAMSQWGDRWMAGDAGAPVIIQHDRCGHDAAAVVICSACGEPLESEDCSMQIGPGYPARLQKRADIRQRFGLDA